MSKREQIINLEQEVANLKQRNCWLEWVVKQIVHSKSIGKLLAKDCQMNLEQIKYVFEQEHLKLEGGKDE